MKIPEEIIKNARGLAVFTIMRTGLWISGAGGSGVLVSRLPDGNWSPPSAILLHTDGVDFLVGIDMYDCVMVLNTEESVNALSRDHYTIGSGLGVICGPVVSGEFNDSEFLAIPAPIYTYLKSQGKHTNVQLLGATIKERDDENERFYSRRHSVFEIINGKVTKTPVEVNRLIQTIKASQGDTDFDPSMLPLEAAPSDFDFADGHTFGVPNKDDPDPFGFLALELEGLSVREAASQQRASRESFQFTPSPNSPLFNAFNRGNVDGSASKRSSWRTSVTERSIANTDSASIATQTELDQPLDSPRPTSLTFRSSMTSIPETELPSIEQTISQESSSWNDIVNNNDLTTAVETDAVTLVERSIKDQTENGIIPETSMEEIKDLERSNTIVLKSVQPVNVSSLAEPTTVSPLEDPTTPPTKNTSPPIAEAGIPRTESPLLNPVFHEDSALNQTEDSDADNEVTDEDEDEDIVIHEIVQAAAPRIISATPQLITKARLVTVSKPPPPPALPSRNPNRSRLALSPSPTRSTFDVDRPSITESRLEIDAHDHHRRGSSAGSSVYSLKKEDVPFSAGATESLGSVSSMDDGDVVGETSLDGSLNELAIQMVKDDPVLHFGAQSPDLGVPRDKAESVVAAPIPATEP